MTMNTFVGMMLAIVLSILLVLFFVPPAYSQTPAVTSSDCGGQASFTEAVEFMASEPVSASVHEILQGDEAKKLADAYPKLPQLAEIADVLSDRDFFFSVWVRASTPDTVLIGGFATDASGAICAATPPFVGSKAQFQAFLQALRSSM